MATTTNNNRDDVLELLLPPGFTEHCRALDDLEWEAYGFSPEEAEAYRGAWCFDPLAAAELRELGITPEVACERVGPGLTDTVGSWFEEGLLTAREALAACGFVSVPDCYVN
jgi:hypothetical protein